MTEIDRTAAELIESAVEEIDKVGWCQNKLFSRDGRACMMGGLYLAAQTLGWGQCGAVGFREFTWNIEFREKFKFVEYAADAIADLLRNDHYYGAPHYNDSSGRTWEECRDKMMETAKTLRERG